MFQILHRDGLSRIAEVSFKNKKIVTPAILPVIHPFKTEPWISTIKKMKIEGVITNSYIMKKGGMQEGKDVHDLLGFDGIVMTDSGTFQEHMYGKLDASNSEMILFQDSVNSDIITIRDVFSEIDHPRETVERDSRENYARAFEATKLTDGYLALPVHGGIYPDQRKKSAEMMSSLETEYFPIGGIVPLMERYMYSTVAKVILSSKMGLKSSNVVHAFGAGHPMFFPLLFLMGVDLIDSSAYIKYARDDRILTEMGTVELNGLSEMLPPSPYFDAYTLKEMKNLSKDERTEAIGLHNLYVTVREIMVIRQQIRDENMWNYAEYRCRSHPLLLEAYRTLQDYYDYLERFEPRSRRQSIFYTGAETFLRPEIRRFRDIEEREETGAVVGKKPYSYYADKPFEYVRTPLGNISMYLDETYPVAQSMFPGEYYDAERDLEKFDMPEWQEFLLQKVNYIFKYQFGKDLFSIVEKNGIKLNRSKNTGKIRNVVLNDEIILSLRASDGLFSLNLKSASLIHGNFEFPIHRVVLDSDSAEFAKQGKSTFAKFVDEADPLIRPKDEVIIVDRDDNLLSYGRAILNREEMVQFKKGIAVKNRLRSTETEE